MKFEIDDKTGRFNTLGFSLNELSSVKPTTIEDLEQIVQAVKKTKEKLGRKPNYKKLDEYEEVPVIIYDGTNGFMIQDIRLKSDPYDINARLRVPSPEEVEKFIKHANIAYKTIRDS